MRQDTVKAIENWQAESTRQSKRQAKDMRNGAFAAYLHEECITKQLAMSFLKFPSVKVGTLLRAWAAYMKDPELAKERIRAAKLNPGDDIAVAEKERQLVLKKKGI